MEVVHEDGGEGSMQCATHPYKNSTPGGICAFCLQEKLGKLVSSSYPVAIFPSTSSSPSPSFRSTFSDGRASSSAASQNNGGGDSRKPRLPFVSTNKKKTMKKDERSSEMVFKRSKSTATPRRGIRFFDEKCVEDYSPNRRRFWSFLHLSKQSTARKSDKQVKNLNFTSPSNVGSSSAVNANGGGGAVRSRERKREDFMAVDENGGSHDNNNEAVFDRKVSRSRSVGCGSRSFSGDFFERISTGFGDCTLRRVESQREGKPKMQSLCCKNGGGGGGGDSGEVCIRQRVKCGGIFGGFVLTSSSSSNLIASSDSNNVGGKSMPAFGHHSHGRSRSWGWAFASPMRAFAKNSAVKRDASSTKNAAAPNLAAIPSLLAVGS